MLKLTLQRVSWSYQTCSLVEFAWIAGIPRETKTQVQMHRQGPIAQLPRQVYTQSRQLNDFKLSQLSPYFSSQFSHSTIFPIWQGSDAWRSTWCMTFADMKLFVILLWFAWHLFVASNAMDSAFPSCGFKSITSQDFRQTTLESGIILFCGFGKKGLLNTIDYDILWLSTRKNYSSGVCIISKK